MTWPFSAAKLLLLLATFLCITSPGIGFQPTRRSVGAPAWRTMGPISIPRKNAAVTAASTVYSAEGLEAEEVDVVVIGSGLGGLSCGALLASRGMSVALLEAHYEIGGCAHEFCVGLDGKTIPTARMDQLAREGKDVPPVFKFEAGPSLYSGLSQDKSPNPLKHVYQMIGEEPEWITYDLWGAHLPEAPDGYELSIGEENFREILRRYGGPTAEADWNMLAEKLRPLAAGVMGLPSTAVRGDAGILLTLAARYPGAFLAVLRDASKILAPFDLSEYGVKDAFLKNYLDLIAFLLQGLPADATLTAVMAYMVEDFYRPGAVMDFPKGGSGALAGALARGITKHAGCSVRTSTAVQRVLVEDGRAVGVVLGSGSNKKEKVIRARRAVVSNADLHGTFALVEEGLHAGFDDERRRLLSPHLAPSPLEAGAFVPTTAMGMNEEGGAAPNTAGGGGAASGTEDEQAMGTGVPLCKSFMHLHLGVDASTLPDDLPPQWTVVTSWEGPIDAPGKVVVVSVPSLLDPSLAPEGHHVIHAYAAGNEPFEVWEPFLAEKSASNSNSGGGGGEDTEDTEDTEGTAEGTAEGEASSSSTSYRRSAAYAALKEERAAPLWAAIERRVPNIRDPGACKVVQVGTPLTHKRFLRRYRGNYGPAIAAGNPAKMEFPPVTTPLPGLYRCGDSTTAGIGVPAVASSGAQCANAILSVWEQLDMNKKISM